MFYVQIDAFDNEEDQVAFAAWLRMRLKNGVQLVTTSGLKTVLDDGVDTNTSLKNTIVLNVEVLESEEDGEGY